MSDPNSPRCPRCDAPMSADAEFRLCPACLLSGAMKDPGDEAPTVPSDPPDATVFPRDLGGYRLDGLLGTGGMGTVYEAEHIETGRRVALKRLDERLDSPELRQRFLREGRLAASVNHPNSLYIFGSEEIESAPVITMEIAPGGTLQDRLDRRGPLPVAEAVDAMLDVISGLEAAFTSGVLHRDVKPSNCFVGPDGSVKVGDFGLSVSTMTRDDSYATASGVILGTPAFASPEQLRGDPLDARADIYSVGATLFTLLTAKAPFDGKNVVQVVANAMNQAPKPLREFREDAPSGLEAVVARCLAKAPNGRYEGYMALRNALLPFSSREPEPASLTIRASAGWIDFLLAFMVPYVPLMLLVGNEEFHLGFFLERTLRSATPYLAFLGFGFLYFALAEGIWGAGLGKRLKGLRVLRRSGRTPGIGRALLRIVIPVLCVEGVRIPLLLATISATRIDDMTTMEIVAYSAATALCPWIPILVSLGARKSNAFATIWDLASGTRVVVKRKGAARPSIDAVASPDAKTDGGAWAGPFRITREVVPGEWIVATDPVLRRPVWLLRRKASEISLARRNVARAGRVRWLQGVTTEDGAWDAFEATPGAPFVGMVEFGKRVPWATLRHWLFDLASELREAVGDHTLPAKLSLDHVWITALGRAVLLDEPWPEVKAPAERVRVDDLAGQQRFLSAVAAHVESTGLPLHARPVLRNLENGTFERLSFLTGTLSGYVDKPVEVGRGVRAASIFLIPSYIWLMFFLGASGGAEWLHEIVGSSAGSVAVATTFIVLAAYALMEFLVLPFRTAIGHATFRLAVVDARGKPSSRSRLLARWAIVWLPLLLAVSLAVLPSASALVPAALALVLLWIGLGAHAVAHPHRGLQDRLAGTWVVRR